MGSARARLEAYKVKSRFSELQSQKSEWKVHQIKVESQRLFIESEKSFEIKSPFSELQSKKVLFTSFKYRDVRKTGVRVLTSHFPLQAGVKFMEFVV